MKTNPFLDTWLFFAGQWGDETALGAWGWLFAILLTVLVVASLVIAIFEWRTDPAQRTGRHVTDLVVRVLIGGMWFVNTLWKLPFFTEENGLHFWTGQESKNAAFEWHGAFVENVLLRTPIFYGLDILVFFTEMAFAMSLILGLGVRLTGTIGVIFVAQLWLGLYRHPTEWAWTYGFLMGLMAIFAVHAFGRSLGLDAMLRRHFAGRSDLVGWLVRLAT